MPFGGNSAPYQRERHPLHGEPANERWTLVRQERQAARRTFDFSMKLRIRRGEIHKRITLVDRCAIIHQRHTLSGIRGPMCFGHHAMVRFPPVEAGGGILSTSAFTRGQVYPKPMELPEQRGYSLLKPGAVFDDLARVPTVTGDVADLTTHPARRGYEDLVMLLADPAMTRAWSAVVFPGQQYLWFAIRDPRILSGTILWLSNGGRHYAPWNGRHVNVVGVEDVCAYFHEGLAESAAPNPLSRLGYRTCHVLRSDSSFAVDYLMGAVAVSRGFDRVSAANVGADGTIRFDAASGERATIQVPPDLVPGA